MAAPVLSLQLPAMLLSIKRLMLPCSMGAGDHRFPSLPDQVRARLQCLCGMSMTLLEGLHDTDASHAALSTAAVKGAALDRFHAVMTSAPTLPSSLCAAPSVPWAVS